MKAGGGGFDALKSDSTHHFFGNACTKSGHYGFYSFRLLTGFVCLYTLPLEDCSEFGNIVITHIQSTMKRSTNTHLNVHAFMLLYINVK